MELLSGYKDMIAMDEIRVPERIRKDIGDIQSLAADMEKHGMINPITVLLTYEIDSGYPIVTGQRRYEAAKLLGWEKIRATLVKADDALDILELEIAENEMRKEFTASEKLAFAKKLSTVEKERARQRKGVNAKMNNVERDDVATEPHHLDGEINDITDHTVDKGRSRDLIAKKAGFSSTTQLRRVEAIAEHAPDLLDKVDSGDLKIGQAYKMITPVTENKRDKPPVIKPKPELDRLVSEHTKPTETDKKLEPQAETPIISQEQSVSMTPVEPAPPIIVKPTVAEQMKPPPEVVKAALKRLDQVSVDVDKIEVEPPVVYTPSLENPSGDDTLTGAGHKQLMNNPVYAKLHRRYLEYIDYAGSLRSFCEGKLMTLRSHRQGHAHMELRIKESQEKILELQQQIDRLTKNQDQ